MRPRWPNCSRKAEGAAHCRGEEGSAQPATTTQTTGEAPRDPTVKQTNEKEKDKVERGGK
jgi:hypothetical protein